MEYGYCRISTRKQSIDRQIRNILSEFPKAKIIEEVYTGTSMNRDKWECLISKVKPGDKIIFDSVSRMSRTAEEGFETYQELFDKGVDLVFLKERYIDTETYKSALKTRVQMTGDKVDVILRGVNEYLMLLAQEQIKLAFEQSEKEVQDLRERTREGIETARRAGKQIGQTPGRTLTTKKSIECKEKILKHSKTFGGSLSDTELLDMLHISRNTLYKYKRELRESQ